MLSGGAGQNERKGRSGDHGGARGRTGTLLADRDGALHRRAFENRHAERGAEDRNRPQIALQKARERGLKNAVAPRLSQGGGEIIRGRIEKT